VTLTCGGRSFVTKIRTVAVSPFNRRWILPKTAYVIIYALPYRQIHANDFWKTYEQPCVCLSNWLLVPQANKPQKNKTKKKTHLSCVCKVTHFLVGIMVGI